MKVICLRSLLREDARVLTQEARESVCEINAPIADSDRIMGARVEQYSATLRILKTIR